MVNLRSSHKSRIVQNTEPMEANPIKIRYEGFMKCFHYRPLSLSAEALFTLLYSFLHSSLPFITREFMAGLVVLNNFYIFIGASLFIVI